MTYPTVPIGMVFTVANGATPRSGEEDLWDGDIPWITPSDLGKNATAEIATGARSITRKGLDSCGTQIVPAGSIVLSIRAPIGHTAIATGPACFNQGCRGLVPSKKILTEFGYWAILSAKPALQSAGQGTTFQELGRDRLRAVKIPLPDLPTQRQIADFLDRETARIDLLIEKKQRLLALLGEKYFAELERATFPTVTPASELVPFRWICRIAEGQVDPTSETWRDRVLIAPNHIESKTGRLLATETAWEQGAISGKYAFGAGTVLYSKIRPALGKACISPTAGMCSADMYPVIPDRRLRPAYLLMQLLSARFTDWATLESMRVAMPKINRETLGGFRLRVPPLDVQDRLVSSFADDRAGFEMVTDRINASIDRLKEYRSALITAAVTGQIDVATHSKSGTPDRRLDAIQEEKGA